MCCDVKRKCDNTSAWNSDFYLGWRTLYVICRKWKPSQRSFTQSDTNKYRVFPCKRQSILALIYCMTYNETKINNCYNLSKLEYLFHSNTVDNPIQSIRMRIFRNHNRENSVRIAIIIGAVWETLFSSKEKNNATS